MIVDGLIVVLTLVWAIFLRFEGDVPPQYLARLPLVLPAMVIMVLGLGHLFGLYRIVRKYTSLGEAWRLGKVVGATAALLAAANIGYDVFDGGRLLPLSIPFIWGPSALIGLAVPRLFRRILAHFSAGKAVPVDADRVLVVGAGDAGEHVVRDAMRNPRCGLRPVAFLDDDPKKIGRKIHGLPVVASIKELPDVVADHRIEKVVIALPNAPSRLIRAILDLVAKTSAEPQILPTLTELMGDEPTSADVRDVDIDDLIGRHQVEVNLDQIATIFENQSVLVTGAAGSIGSELARQALRFRPSTLLLLDNNETDLYLLKERLCPVAASKGTNLKMLVADIRDRRRIDGIFEKYAPQLLLHAAAYKHVSVMEEFPCEAVKTNVGGTRNLAEAARNNGTMRFVLVSTDKAVNPTSVMGATKRAAEMVLSTLAKGSATTFASVRFGNVLGSRGSVVPIIAEQIQNGGPITVTHEEASRYFMTVREAAALICQAGAIAEGGETFVLEMGEPVRIMDLARRMRDLLAQDRADQVEIVVTGLRQGEKLHEELWHDGEVVLGKVQTGILRARSAIVGLDVAEVDVELRKLEEFALQESESEKILNQMQVTIGCRTLSTSILH